MLYTKSMSDIPKIKSFERKVSSQIGNFYTHFCSEQLVLLESYII